MTIIGKILKAIAMVLLVVVLIHIFCFTLRLEIDDQKLRSGEATLDQVMSKEDIVHSLIRAALVFFASQIFAGLAFIIDTMRKVDREIDDLPEQIPANNIESKRKKKK